MWSANTVKITLIASKGNFLHVVKYGIFSVTFGLALIGSKLVQYGHTHIIGDIVLGL